MKTHGEAGIFDIGLPFSGPVGIECRSGGGSGDYESVLTLPEPITVGSASVLSMGATLERGCSLAQGRDISIRFLRVNSSLLR